jgi:hypothetical protein
MIDLGIFFSHLTLESFNLKLELLLTQVLLHLQVLYFPVLLSEFTADYLIFF